MFYGRSNFKRLKTQYGKPEKLKKYNIESQNSKTIFCEQKN